MEENSNIEIPEYEIEEKPKKKSDGMEDLFSIPTEELLDTSDVVSVDMEKDVLDANEEGNLDDLTTVTKEDVMGNPYGQSPLDGAAKQRRKARVKRVSIVRPTYYTPTQIGGISG